MKKLIIKFWDWYNRMKEPWRMLFAVFVLISPIYLPQLINDFYPGHGKYWASLMFIEILIIGSKIFYDDWK